MRASAFGPIRRFVWRDGPTRRRMAPAVVAPHGVGASADFAVEALIGVVDQIWSIPVGEGREGDVRPGLIEVVTHGGASVVHVVQEPRREC